MNRLLLEDDISLVEGLLYCFRKNGFDVEVVRTVKEALATPSKINQMVVAPVIAMMQPVKRIHKISVLDTIRTQSQSYLTCCAISNEIQKKQKCEYILTM